MHGASVDKRLIQNLIVHSNHNYAWYISKPKVIERIVSYNFHYLFPALFVIIVSSLSMLQRRLCTVYQCPILPIVLSKQYCTSNKALHNTCSYTISKNVKFGIHIS